MEIEYPVPREDFCLVIMSFSQDKHLTDIYRFGIHDAVTKAGYSCLRVDEVEHNRRITDLMLSKIECSRFIVADLSEARPNCYYELGWAHRAGKQVILTIHVDTPIHFDVQDYKFITYENAGQLHDQLHKRVIDSIGRGPARLEA
jgi:nucleoside 2-deoxyribosyltransferase